MTIIYGIVSLSHHKGKSKTLDMTNWKILGVASFIVSSVIVSGWVGGNEPVSRPDLSEDIICYATKGCVFRTVFGEESSDHDHLTNTPENVRASINRGLDWIITAQQKNGGWGAGSHHRQDIMDPHAVSTDPATTAMVAMALLRTGARLEEGEYSIQLRNALEYILTEIEETPANRANITDQQGTQIQTKLGRNIDTVLALQFLTNMMEFIPKSTKLYTRVLNASNICTEKIQSQQSADGSISGDGWAGVLQSSLANNALEAASYYGADVDEESLERSREYQEANYDPSSGSVNTSKGAGIVLYSVSGSVRASAKQARRVREEVKKAKDEGKIDENAEITDSLLRDMGYSEEEAMKLSTSYQVYESSKNVAQEEDVISGFGNNGGEEFLSYLQTGESLIINDDNTWSDWFDATSSRLLSIQNQDGSWNGHHCITSPVFCTATTLLILSISEDKDRLVQLGSE